MGWKYRYHLRCKDCGLDLPSAATRRRNCLRSGCGGTFERLDTKKLPEKKPRKYHWWKCNTCGGSFPRYAGDVPRQCTRCRRKHGQFNYEGFKTGWERRL